MKMTILPPRVPIAVRVKVGDVETLVSLSELDDADVDELIDLWSKALREQRRKLIHRPREDK